MHCDDTGVMLFIVLPSDGIDYVTVILTEGEWGRFLMNECRY